MQRMQRNMLVTALGSYGDVYPMVGIANQLKQRGHQVTLFTHAHFAKVANQYSLDCVNLDTEGDYETFANHPDLFDPRKAFSVFMQTVVMPNLRRVYAALLDYVQPGNTVLVASMTVFAARLIQEKYGTPMVTIHTIPLQIKSAYEKPRVAGPSLPDWSPLVLKKLFWWVADKAVIDPLICPELNTFRGEVGLKPISHVLTKWVHSPDAVVCMYPEWFASPQPDWPPNTFNTGFPLFDEGDEDELADEVRIFLDEGPPPIVFMPGSLMQKAESFFIESRKACDLLGFRAIFLTRYADQIPDDLPLSIKHFAYVPFSRLLPHSALLVHHGGVGTTAQTLRAGIPQLIHPLAYDQFDNAARVEGLGVGTSIKPENYVSRVLVNSLKFLTTSLEVKRNCQEIASRFVNAQPLEHTCDIIERLIP